MEAISNVTIAKLDTSNYVTPYRMLYNQNGRNQVWDFIRDVNIVAAIILNVSRNKLVFVKQFRPPVYYARVLEEKGNAITAIDTKKYPPSLGVTIELCGGQVDKKKSLAEIIREEILEECGYDVPLSRIEKVTSYRSDVGVNGAMQTMYYTEVTDAMKKGKGGGNPNEGEFINVVEMSLPEAKKLIVDESVPRPPSMLFGLEWFFSKKAKNN